MKLNKKIIITLIIALSFIMLTNIKSYGAIAITKGTEVFTNKTISEFFDLCREMKNAGQGLEGTTVDPHMATNKEWATVSYFSNSNYGTATLGKNNGIDVTIDGTTYKSTNGNATGVMDWGKTATFTAGVLSTYTNLSDTDTLYTDGKSIIENATNSQYVDLVDVVSWEKMAATGWFDSGRELRSDLKYPYSVRCGLWGHWSGNAIWLTNRTDLGTTGKASIYTTFRPVLFN